MYQLFYKLISILVLCIYFPCIHTVHVENYNAGVIFEPQEEVKLITGRANIVAVINFRDIIAQHDMILTQFKLFKDKFNHISNKNAEFLSPISDDTMTATTHLLHSYFHEFNILSNIIPSVNHVIKQRSIFPFIGRMHNFLYGSLTDDDKNEIISNYNSLVSSTNNIKSNLNSTIIYIKNLEDHISNNTLVLQDVCIKITSHLESLDKHLKSLEYKFSDTTNKIHTDMVLFNMLSQFNLLLTKARIDLISFRNSISQSKQAHLSSTLFSPYQFFEVLLKLESNLPYEFKFHTMVSVQNIEQFYMLANVEIIFHDNNLLLLISLPLTTQKQRYLPYHITPIPYFQSNINHYMQWQTQKYLYINADNTTYFLTDTPLLCLHPKTHISLCTYTQTIFSNTIQTCELNLFYNKTANLCTRSIFTAHTPFLYRVKNDIIFSTFEKTTLNLICYYANLNIKPFTFTINEHGLIKDCLECTIHGERFSLNSDFRINTTINTNQYFNMSILRGSIPPPINFTHNSINFADINRSLSNLSFHPHSKINLELLLNDLNNHKISYYHSQNSMKTSFITSIIFTFLILVCIIIFYIRFKKLSCCCKNKPKHVNTPQNEIVLNKVIQLPNIRT